MRVRVAIDLDIPKLLEIGFGYSEEAKRWKGLKYDPAKTAFHIANAINDSDQQIFLKCNDDNEVLGFMWVGVAEPVWSSDRLGYDIFLYVSPEHRNISVAKELVKEYEAWARACGAKVIHTGANSGVYLDKAAASFYSGLGYVSGGYNFYKDLKEK